MTQNPTKPEDNQHNSTDTVDAVDQAPSTGAGQGAQAHAPNGEQSEGLLFSSGASADSHAAHSASQDPHKAHNTGYVPDYTSAQTTDPTAGQASTQTSTSQNDEKPKGRGMLSSWRGRATKPAPVQESVEAAGSATSAAAAVQPNAAQKFFETASRVGPFFLLLILLAQAWPAFMGNGLYCPREAESILIFNQTSQSGLWLAPAAPGLAHWPVYHWYLAGMQCILEMAGPSFGPLLFPLAGLAGAVLCVLGVWTLARVAGLSSQAALAGGMILLSAPLFVPLAHFTGPESLATALTLFALALLCHGWQKPQAWISLPAGFVLAALAGLTGGLFQIMLPLVASIFFLGWRGTFRRAQGLDGVTGFVLLLLLVACWLGGVMLWQQPEGYLKFLGERLMLWPWPSTNWWLPLLIAAAGLLPWLAIVACVSWVRVLRTAPGDLVASRKDRAGIAFMWISVAVAAVLSLTAYDPVSASLTVICLAAPLLGKALLRLTGLGGRLFFIFAALCLLHAGMALAAAGFGPTLDWMGGFFKFTLTADQREMVLGLKALPILGVICIIAAILLARMVRKGAHGGMGGALLICAVIVILLAQPGTLLLGPQLKAVPQAKLRHIEEILMPATAPAPEAPAAETPAPEAATPAEESTTPENVSPDAAAPQAPATEGSSTDSGKQLSPVEAALEKAASEAAAYDAKMMEEMDIKHGKVPAAPATAPKVDGAAPEAADAAKVDPAGSASEAVPATQPEGAPAVGGGASDTTQTSAPAPASTEEQQTK
ncbi:MAG: hypothetical protein QM579_07935 [Desulfovibrio sp.]|uniref:ArnT family glycosyltransferase n=1 Tax=Desulfovibrio sp. TaxID=885 RepID=UPI0039E54F5D